MAAVEHDHGGARALVVALRHHQVGVVDVDPGAAACRLPPRAVDVQPLHGVEDGAARVDVERVAELVGLGRGNRLDAGAQVPRVVQPRAAAAHRAEQIAQRAVAQEVQRLVGDLELHAAGVLADAAAGARAPLALGLEVRRAGDEAALHHAVDDLLDEVLELLAHAFLIAVGRLAEQLLHARRRTARRR